MAQSDTWTSEYYPCKKSAIASARLDRHETYNAKFLAWHWRLGGEQLLYSHQTIDPNTGKPRYMSNDKPMLLACGLEDTVAFNDICPATQNTAPKMIATPGKALFLAKTGHSLSITNDARILPGRSLSSSAFDGRGTRRRIMKLLVKSRRMFLGFFVLTALGSFTQAGSAQETLGTVSYAAPTGWTKTTKTNIVAFSKVDPVTGKFCIITLYGATPGTGKPASDFKREWANLVLKNMKADAEPKTESAIENGWTATGGGSEVETDGTKAFALLTVISGGGRTVSVLGVFNDPVYIPELAEFSDSIMLGAATAAAPSAPTSERPAAPAATSEVMNINSLAKEFQDNEVRANQTWIGKRVRVIGTVNSVVIAKDGNVEVTFKTSITNNNMAKCFFSHSQSAGVARLTAHTEAVVEGTVRGLGGGFDNSKGFFLLESCVVP